MQGIKNGWFEPGDLVAIEEELEQGRHTIEGTRHYRGDHVVVKRERLDLL